MPQELEPRSLIAQYRIVSRIGSGGMGEVYLAEDTKLDRQVAIKVLHAELAKDDDRVRRFVREAKAASGLNHPNILTIHEIGEFDGRHYIATELIKGETLRDRLRHGSLTLRETIDIALQAASALNAAHEAGIVHRDIKPENIMIRDDGGVKILDFGLVKLSEKNNEADSSDPTRVKTSPGTVMGTATYMSPEQARGKETDNRTDIWSLGVVLYEMVAGRTPFAGESTNDTIAAILKGEPDPLDAEIPHDLRRMIRRTLQKRPDERYQTVKDLLLDIRDLKRDLEFSEELERSHVPSISRSSNVSTTGQISENPTVFLSGSPSTQTSLAAHPSSAEYLVTEVKKHKFASLAVLGVLVLATAGFGYWFLNRAAAPNIGSIAVLPLQNNSGNPDSDYLSDGLAESLIYRLSQLPDLKVSSASSVMRYKGQAFDPKKIAGELGVEAVLSGRLTQRGDNLNISVELIDAATNNTLWGEQYDRKMSDLLATQREIATAIADKLQLRLSGDEARGITKRYTNDNEAYQLYLKGRFQWNKRTVDGLRAAESFYKQAIERDPSFALAYSGLAETFALFANYSVAPPKESFPKAKAAALKAIELDPTLAEPHAALGLYYTGYAWNDPLAEKEFRRAIELNPNYATAHHWLGNATLVSMKRFDDALAAGQRAIEIDPLSVIISADQGWNYILAHRYDEAIAQVQQTLKLDPNFYYAHYNIGWAYLEKGMYPEAIASLRKSLELNEDPYAKALLVCALAESGARAEALKLRDELKTEYGRRYLAHYFLAMASHALGDTDEAFALVDKDLDERSIYAAWIRIDPRFDDIRGDPRYALIVKKIESMKLD